MTIVVGCDNAAVDLKNTLIACLKEQGVTVEDEGDVYKRQAVQTPSIS